MEDNAIEQGFRDLKDGKEYDNLFAAACCREWVDWLIGINATRLFSILYYRTLNVGRVVSPTLALLVQREAEIGAFKPEPFYTAELDFGSFTATSEKFKKKSEADAVIPKGVEPIAFICILCFNFSLKMLIFKQKMLECIYQHIGLFTKRISFVGKPPLHEWGVCLQEIMLQHYSSCWQAPETLSACIAAFIARLINALTDSPHCSA